MLRRWIYALILVAVAHASWAVDIPSILVPKTASQEKSPPALRLMETNSVAPLAALRPAEVGAADQLEAISVWNHSGGVPAKNGFARPLPKAANIRFTADLLKQQPSRFAGGALLAPPAGGLVWGAELRVENSYRLRLHLADVRLPKGTQMWVYDEDGGEEVYFSADDVTTPEREIWAPSVAGPVARLEVRLPEGAVDGYGFRIDQVMQLFDLDASGSPRLGPSGSKVDFSCAQDAACYDNSSLGIMDLYKRAVARLGFVKDGSSYLCSGGLMNDTDNSTFIPYLLTAHHCFDTQSSASTLEAIFDYIDQGCLGTPPSLGGLPRTVGATLLATGATTDFTFVRLSSLPPGRGLLGSTSASVGAGTTLHRLSHPFGIPMGYSVAAATAGGPSCSALPRPNFIYSGRALGAVFEGSSGSPVVRGSDGAIVGQLFGACGPTAAAGEGCDPSNATVDGAMSGTWASIVQWLIPTSTPVCTPSATALCLANGRFKVEATFNTGAQQGQAQVVNLTDETGYLWFFSAGNVEMVVKVLDACSFNQRFWVFAGGLTNVQVTLTVTDTQKGTVKTYTNPQGAPFQPIQDTGAFATCN